MTFGTTQRKEWVEAIPKDESSFAGRTFSRFHIYDADRNVPTVGEIWATSDHSVQSHAHDADELLYVLSGVIIINGCNLGPNEVVFIPKGESYGARVITSDGARVLRIELPANGRATAESEYEAKVWRGPLTDEETPDLKSQSK